MLIVKVLEVLFYIIMIISIGLTIYGVILCPYPGIKGKKGGL
jgi:hypothetical protein